MGKDRVYRQDFPFYSFNADRHNQADLVWYFQILQEISLKHSQHVGLGWEELDKKGLAWVAFRNIIEIDRYVRWPQTVRVETWAGSIYKLYFPRIVRAFDETGNKLFESHSYWLLLDRNRHGRPVPPAPYLAIYGLPDGVDSSRPTGFPSRLVPDEELPQANVFMPPVLYQDTDFNMHVNNITYVKWFIESMPEAFRDTHKACFMDINWNKQTFSSDTIKIITSSKDGTMQQDSFQHYLEKTDKEGNTTISSCCMTKWKTRKEMS
jgi:acyl-ACP thioesterase